MGWEKLIDALDELETEVEYDGYFCSVKDAVAEKRQRQVERDSGGARADKDS